MKRYLIYQSSVLISCLLLASIALAGERVFFYHTDAAGTPMAMTDESGDVVWEADYLPFGEEQEVLEGVQNKNRFIGKEKDEETDLYYFGARYLDARIGRFISTDPVGPVDPWSGKTNEQILLNPQNLNKYSYGLNNPYRFIDPDGNFPIDTVWDIGNVLYDVYKRDWTSAAADTGAMFIPYVPAGMTKAVKGLDKMVDASKAAKWGRSETLAKHFADHGKDFGAKSADEYANMASDFLVKAQKGKLPTKISKDGTIRVYDPKTNTFGSYNSDGTTKTFYKPTGGKKYWDRQKGKEL